MDWLVDTNILIDHLRGVSKATTFLRAQERNCRIAGPAQSPIDLEKGKLNKLADKRGT